MPRKKYEVDQRDTELLEKILVVQLYALGAAQDQIARLVGRQKLWVNQLLRGIPRPGGVNGSREKRRK